MKKHTTPVSPVQRLEAELAEWRGKRAQFAAELEVAERTAEAANVEREAVLLAAMAEGNREAAAQLDEATARGEAASGHARDLLVLCTKIDGKVGELTQQLTAAQRAADVVELGELAAQRVQVDGQIVQALGALVPALVEWMRLADDMEVLADRLQVPGAEAFGRRFVLSTHLATALPPGLLHMRHPLADHRIDDLQQADREALDTLLSRLEPRPSDKAAA